MATRTDNTEAPAFLYNSHLIDVQYSFAEYTTTHHWNTTSKVWLDILFMHPEHTEVINIRIAKSSLLLCQPKEVIESVVHREIREFLHASFPAVGAAAHKELKLVPAFS